MYELVNGFVRSRITPGPEFPLSQVMLIRYAGYDHSEDPKYDMVLDHEAGGTGMTSSSGTRGDVQYGTGRVALPLAPHARTLTGVDNSRAMLDVCAATHFCLIGRAGENMVLDMRTTLIGRLPHAQLRAFRKREHGDVFTPGSPRSGAWP